MSSEAFNGLVDAAARNQELRGVKRRGTPSAPHHWKVKTQRHPDKGSRLWRVIVGPGTVNDRMAAISYLPKGDPRGWKMPADWPGKEEMKRYYHTETPPVVDRLLTEYPAPFLLMTVPAAHDEKDAGDFSTVPDEQRPEIFRTATMWEKEIWKAVVFVTASKGQYSTVESRLHFPLPAINTRFRVAVANRLPSAFVGVQLGGHLQLAEIYLARRPGFPGSDQMFVKQTCFWSLWTANAEAFLDYDPFLPRGVLLIPGIGGIIIGQLGEALLDLVIDQTYQEIAHLYEQSASVEFWSAV